MPRMHAHARPTPDLNPGATAYARTYAAHPRSGNHVHGLHVLPHVRKSASRICRASHACTCTANTCSGPRIYRVCTHIRGTSTIWQLRARHARVAPHTRICSSLPAQSEHFRHRYFNPPIRSISHRIVKSHWCICNPPIKSFFRQFVKSDWCECICPHSHQSHSARLAGPSVGTLPLAL